MNADKDEALRAVAPVLDLPDEPAEWPGWLEQQLAGLQLRDLVEQLVAMGAAHPPRQTLDEVLGAQREAVLRDGLHSSLDADQAGQLIRNPALLLELQDLVLRLGGSYWSEAPRTAEHRNLVASVRQAVAAGLPAEAGTAFAEAADAGPPMTAQPSANVRPLTADSDHAPRRLARWGLFAAVAAALLLGAFLLPRPPADGAFFAAAELQQVFPTPQAALRRMASRVRQDWQPAVADAPALKKQLVLFRDSCDYLIDGPLTDSLADLPAEVRDDVRERCRRWQEQATQLIAALDAGRSTPEVQGEADVLVAKLTAKLEEIAGPS